MEYFYTPKQVMFVDPDNPEQWIAGIAYQTEIICACCGGIFEISDVEEIAKEAGYKKAIYPYSTWESLTDELTGGCPPTGLIKDEKGRIVEVNE